MQNQALTENKKPILLAFAEIISYLCNIKQRIGLACGATNNKPPNKILNIMATLNNNTNNVMAQDKKYILLENDTITMYNGVTLYRIKAIRDFGKVKAGDLGGYIKGEHNLSHEGTCWVSDNAQVCNDAKVLEDAQIYGSACVHGFAYVYGNARVYGNAEVHGDSHVYGNAQIYGKADIAGFVRIYGNAQVYGNARVYDSKYVQLDRVYANTRVYGNAQVYGNAEVYENGQVYGNTQVYGDSKVCDD